MSDTSQGVVQVQFRQQSAKHCAWMSCLMITAAATELAQTKSLLCHAVISNEPCPKVSMLWSRNTGDPSKAKPAHCCAVLNQRQHSSVQHSSVQTQQNSTCSEQSHDRIMGPTLHLQHGSAGTIPQPRCAGHEFKVNTRLVSHTGVA